MIWRKKYLPPHPENSAFRRAPLFMAGCRGLLFLAVFGFALFLALALVKLGDFNFVFAQGEELSCEVRSSACGDTKPVEIFQMYNTSNSHAAKPGQSYGYHVCCGGVTGLSNACSGNYKVVLRLSGDTNAHARQNTYEDYSGANKACMSVSSGSVDVEYVLGDSSCSSGYVALASMSKATNAHVGNATAYTGASNYKICAKFTPLSTAIEIRAQNYTSAVTTITFPAGAPSDVISTPTNGIGAEVQGFGGAGVAKPVVTLLNGSSGVLRIWYTITTFSGSVAASEKYLIAAKGAEVLNAAAVNVDVVFDTLTNSTIQITNGAGNEKDLYLVLTLSALFGKTGTSTLTILGETP